MSTYIKQKGSEKVIFQTGSILAPVAGAATTNTSYLDCGDGFNWLCKVSAGTVGTSVNVKIQQATDASGTSVKDITGLAITALTSAGSALINIVQSDLDIDNGFTHIRANVITVGASTVVGVDLISLDQRNEITAQGTDIDETIS